jgi:hypothetical protein
MQAAARRAMVAMAEATWEEMVVGSAGKRSRGYEGGETGVGMEAAMEVVARAVAVMAVGGAVVVDRVGAAMVGAVKVVERAGLLAAILVRT